MIVVDSNVVAYWLSHARATFTASSGPYGPVRPAVHPSSEMGKSLPELAEPTVPDQSPPGCGAAPSTCS